ncbi:MAG TPA: DUF488 family protein [Solirubrobacterales bacterium]|nr:DUF488 family protein [Solirubrobacterales bacterium]
MGKSRGELRVARIYEEPTPADGRRILVDRLWPRGVSKEKAKLDDWCREVAPSDELRRWYGHDPERFEEFSARYRKELAEGERAAALARIAAAARRGVVTLLTATKEPEISQAAVLKGVIEERGRR